MSGPFNSIDHFPHYMKKGMPFHVQRKLPGLQVLTEAKEDCLSGKLPSKEEGEPRSVLDNQRSPSPPTSAATPSSSAGGEWAAQLQPMPPALGSVDGWDSMLSERPAADSGSENSFLRWFMADTGDGTTLEGGGMWHGGVDQGPIGGIGGEAPPISMVLPRPHINVSPFIGSTNNGFKAPAFGNPSFLINQNQQVHSSPNLPFFLPIENQMAMAAVPSPALYPSQTNFGSGPELSLHRNAMDFHLQQQAPDEAASQHQAVVDQLIKAAELVEAGNTISAHMILARLNHQLPSPLGKPLIRSAFYFKEALLAASTGGSEQRRRLLATPLDIMFKLSAYKAFAEVSPVLQFTSFTSTQAILEALTGAENIHVIDFDVGVGGHWPALIQELSLRRSAVTGVPPQLRISAFVSMALHHPLELHLIQENLTHFAANLHVPFELNLLPLESFDPRAILCSSSPSGEVIAVNFAGGHGNLRLSMQTLLHLIKQLSPKIVIFVNYGCDRNDLPFSHSFLHAFQSSTVLLDSVEASGVSTEVADKIERYLIRPRIESSVLRHHQDREKLLSWRMLFASVGFAPVQFSNFAETQAESLLKRVQLRGFQVERRQAALVMSWQQGDIASVSAWSL